MVLAILLYMYEKFIRHTQINLCPNTQLLNTRHRAYRSFSNYFRVRFRLHRYGTLG